jgi:hypothetical protein
MNVDELATGEVYNICIYVYMYVYNVCHVCIYIMHIYLCMYVFIYGPSMNVDELATGEVYNICIYVYMYVYMYIMYVMCVYILCIFIYEC